MRFALIFATCTVTSFAGKLTDTTMSSVYNYFSSEKYDSAVTSILNNIPDNQQHVTPYQITQMADELKKIAENSGKPISYDKVGTEKLGNVEGTTFLIYCKKYPIRFRITEYSPQIGAKPHLLHFLYDSEVHSWFK